jgi:hypothetical protein
VALSVLVIVAQSYFVLGVPLLHPLRGAQAAFAIVALAAAATSNSRFHTILAAVSPFTYVPIIVSFYLEPSQLVSSP